MTTQPETSQKNFTTYFFKKQLICDYLEVIFGKCTSYLSKNKRRPLYHYLLNLLLFSSQQKPKTKKSNQIKSRHQKTKQRETHSEKRNQAIMDDETLSSSSSNLFASAPSSPGRSAAPSSSAAHLPYFFSAPTSPTHFLFASSPVKSVYSSVATGVDLEQADFEFNLAARSMSTAEELFFNGQIRPGFVSMDHASVPDPASIHRRSRSVSPTRTPRMIWREQRKELAASLKPKSESEAESNSNTVSDTTKSDSVSASTSRSSSSSSSSSNSSNANSRRWAIIKDLLTLRRSRSEGKLLVTSAGTGSRPVQRQRNNNNCANGCEGSGNGRWRLTYSASFSPGLCKDRQRRSADKSETVHLVKEATRRTTFLPYKQQGFLFGCLGFRSRAFVRNVGIPAIVSRHS